MTREAFLAKELLDEQDECSRLRTENALLKDLLRGMNMVLVPSQRDDLLSHPQGAML